MIFPVNGTIARRWLGHYCRDDVFVISGEPWELELHAQAARLLYPQGPLHSGPRITGPERDLLSMLTRARILRELPRVKFQDMPG
jgi:hypothetical protein